MTSESTTNKPFRIEKRRVYEAYKAVKSNQGAAGVDGETLALQLQLIEGSESMGDHDSGSDDWWCVG